MYVLLYWWDLAMSTVVIDEFHHYYERAKVIKRLYGNQKFNLLCSVGYSFIHQSKIEKNRGRQLLNCYFSSW